MARNQFGCICDKCGKMSKYKNEFYHLNIPTYETEINNCVQAVDYCLNCYIDLKEALAKHYKINWIKEKTNG